MAFLTGAVLTQIPSLPPRPPPSLPPPPLPYAEVERATLRALYVSTNGAAWTKPTHNPADGSHGMATANAGLNIGSTHPGGVTLTYGWNVDSNSWTVCDCCRSSNAILWMGGPHSNWTDHFRGTGMARESCNNLPNDCGPNTASTHSDPCFPPTMAAMSGGSADGTSRRAIHNFNEELIEDCSVESGTGADPDDLPCRVSSMCAACAPCPRPTPAAMTRPTRSCP